VVPTPGGGGKKCNCPAGFRRHSCRSPSGGVEVMYPRGDAHDASRDCRRENHIDERRCAACCASEG
jgi:hypothetical protein